MSPVMTPMPIERFLTTAEPNAMPASFTRSRQELTRGLPFQWPLESDLSLVLLVPAGTAALWRDADPDTVVSAAVDERLAHAAPRGADPHEQPPARLILRQGRSTLATIPLVAGVSRVTPDGDGGRTIIELLVAGWLLHAGCVRGPGDYGSFVEVAWRRVENGTAAFRSAPIGPPSATFGPRGGYLP